MILDTRKNEFCLFDISMLSLEPCGLKVLLFQGSGDGDDNTRSKFPCYNLSTKNAAFSRLKKRGRDQSEAALARKRQKEHEKVGNEVCINEPALRLQPLWIILVVLLFRVCRQTNGISTQRDNIKLV